ncbi:MAG TPA: hypothetical protein VIH57_08765 [Bacteroidales bacterium]
MKSLLIKVFLFLIIGLVSNGCENNKEVSPDFKTGLNCMIKYGQGDCMPIFGESNRKYNDYTGKIFIVNKRDYDNLIDKNINCNCVIKDKIDSLKGESISLRINDGKLIKELQPDSFIIMLDTEYIYYNNNEVYLKSDTIVSKNIYFYNCTSY